MLTDYKMCIVSPNIETGGFEVLEQVQDGRGDVDWYVVQSGFTTHQSAEDWLYDRRQEQDNEENLPLMF